MSSPKIDVTPLPGFVILMPLTKRLEPSKRKLLLSTILPEALPT